MEGQVPILEELPTFGQRELAPLQRGGIIAQTRLLLVNKHFITYLTYAHSCMLNSCFQCSTNITQNCFTVETFIFQMILEK